MSCLGRAVWDGSVSRECEPGVWAGGVGRESEPGVWAGSVGWRCRPEVWDGGTGNLYPFRQVFAVWVEIYDRRLPESLPFSADFHLLGRDFQPAATGISTLFG